jgi:hypothetical protein
MFSWRFEAHWTRNLTGKGGNLLPADSYHKQRATATKGTRGGFRLDALRSGVVSFRLVRELITFFSSFRRSGRCRTRRWDSSD